MDAQDGAAAQRNDRSSIGRSKSPEVRVGLPASCDPPGPNNPPKQLVWIVFGATGHIGRSLVRCALSHGDLVCAVGQTGFNSPAHMVNWHPSCLGTLCDVRSRSSVEAVIQKALSHFGRIDLIANCSGTALIGACEDQSCDEIRNQFETNFMGTLNILQSSLPYFRQRMGGRYLVFSSTSAALGVPGIGPYCASKYAVEGLIEAMLYEVDAFNIKATLVEPGIVSRDDPQAHLPSPSPGDTSRPTGPLSQVNKQEHSNSSTDTRARKPDPNSLPLYGHFKVCPSSAPYDTPDHPAGHYTRMAQWLGDRQPTSVVKSAELVWQLGHCSFPPLRFLLGQLAVESIRDRLRCVIEEGEDWRNLNWPSEEGSGGVGGGGADEEKKDDDFREDGGEDRDKDLEQSADVEDGEDDMEPEAMDTQS